MLCSQHRCTHVGASGNLTNPCTNPVVRVRLPQEAHAHHAEVPSGQQRTIEHQVLVPVLSDGVVSLARRLKTVNAWHTSHFEIDVVSKQAAGRI